MNGSAVQSSASPDTEPIAYPVPQVAKLLNIGVRTTWTLVHTGQLKSFKVGKARRVRRTAIDEYLDRQEEAAATEAGAA